MNVNAVTTTTYASKPLHTSASTNIRLVELLLDDSPHASTTPQISCKLQVVSLEGSPSYVCLSYVWGYPTLTETILLDGEPFTVRLNLYNFLVQMKREGNSGLFWIDAICIDQSSILERNHQVGMMGKIYSEATKVIAWLGAGPESRSRAVKELGGFLSLEPKRLDRIWIVVSLNELYQSDYWSRIWIVQEYVLGKEVQVQCGGHKLGGNDLYQLIQIVQHPYLLPENLLDIVARQPVEHDSHGTSARQIVTHRFDRAGILKDPVLHFIHNFQHLFNTFRRMGCADVRDRVYAVLSLAEPDDLSQFPIHPDYAKSASALFVELIERLRHKFRRQLSSGTRDMGLHELERCAVHLQRGLGLSLEDPIVQDTLLMTRKGRDLSEFPELA